MPGGKGYDMSAQFVNRLDVNQTDTQTTALHDFGTGLTASESLERFSHAFGSIAKSHATVFLWFT